MPQLFLAKLTYKPHLRSLYTLMDIHRTPFQQDTRGSPSCLSPLTYKPDLRLGLPGIQRVFFFRAPLAGLSSGYNNEAGNTVDGRNPAPLGNHGKPLLVGICRGIIIPGLLGWCRTSSIHSSGSTVSSLRSQGLTSVHQRQLSSRSRSPGASAAPSCAAWRSPMPWEPGAVTG